MDSSDYTLGYDTIKICLNGERLLSHMEETVQGFEYIKDGVNGRVRLGGLAIYVDQFKLIVGKGSLCKFFFGNNLRSLGQTETKQAVEMLSDTLALPMEKGQIWRVDIGANMLTNYPSEVYFKELGLLPYYERVPMPHGVRYDTRQKQLVFYDKKLEMLKEGESVPDVLLKQNILRYELRYSRKCGKQFGLEGGVPVSMLYEDGFYNDICDNWREMYKAINKENNLILNFSAAMKKRKQPTAAYNYLAQMALVKQLGGVAETINLLKTECKKGTITPKQYYSLCALTKKAGERADGLTSMSDAIMELDKLILGCSG